MMKKRVSRPGKLSRANANAASVQVTSWPTVTSTATSTLSSLGETPAPTAIVSLNNFMTIGVMRALTDLGVRYQEDLSLIGVDDLDWADVMRIRPTLIAQPIEAMTRTAIAALLEQLTTAEPSQKRRILFAPKLTERESCAPPALC